MERGEGQEEKNKERLVGFVSVARVRPRTSKGHHRPVIASNFHSLPFKARNGPSKKSQKLCPCPWDVRVYLCTRALAFDTHTTLSPKTQPDPTRPNDPASERAGGGRRRRRYVCKMRAGARSHTHARA